MSTGLYQAENNQEPQSYRLCPLAGGDVVPENCGIISAMVVKNLAKGLVLAVMVLWPARVLAQSSSSNYSVEESSFSSGSGTGNSASYSAQGSAGDLGVGSAFSTSYGAYAGPISPNEEYLEMVVSAATINLDTPSAAAGILTDTETATGTGSFYVRSYLNSTYTVVTASPSMTNESGDTIAPMTSTASPSAGTEQFGINLVDNTTPNIGSNPAPQPDSSYANGAAATGYGTADQFRYNQGETIAEDTSAPAWGQTNFTLSYIANISSITEAGSYQMVHTLIVIATF